MAESYPIQTTANKRGVADDERRNRALQRNRQKQQARAVRMQQKQSRGQTQNPSIDATPPPKKLTGPVFGLMVLLAVVKDIADLLLGITIILSLFVFVITIPIALTLFGYYKFNGVKFTTRKLATFAISFIIEVLPFIGILPATTLSLFVIKRMENSERLKKFMQTQTTIKA